MLKIENISKTFNQGTVNERRALKDFSLEVQDGEFVTVIGSNGCGKSTLFNMIAGTLISDEGRIVLDGEDVTLLPEHKRARYIGRLFQDPMMGTAPSLTVMENLALAAQSGGWLGMINNADRERFTKALSDLDMGLEDRLYTEVGTLSGGQRQALALVMATINPPKLLLLDEHTAALDPGGEEKVLKLTEKVVSEGHISCLMITHSMSQALRYGDRLIMMDDGQIVLDVKGEEKKKTKVEDLLKLFTDKAASLDV